MFSCCISAAEGLQDKRLIEAIFEVTFEVRQIPVEFELRVCASRATRVELGFVRRALIDSFIVHRCHIPSFV